MSGSHFEPSCTLQCPAGLQRHDTPTWDIWCMHCHGFFKGSAPDAGASDASASDAKHFQCWLPSNGYWVKATEVVSCSYRVACSWLLVVPFSWLLVLVCVCVCVRACVHVCVRACVCTSIVVSMKLYSIVDDQSTVCDNITLMFCSVSFLRND